MLSREVREAPTLFSVALTIRWRSCSRTWFTIIHRDADGQDALNGASVKGAFDEGWSSSSTQFEEHRDAVETSRPEKWCCWSRRGPL